jgi:hypothetical protein
MKNEPSLWGEDWKKKIGLSLYEYQWSLTPLVMVKSFC